MGYFIPMKEVTDCPCCGGPVEQIHPLQVIGTIVLALVAWLGWAAHKAWRGE